MEHRITKEEMKQFERYLARGDRSDGTIRKYLHDLQALSAWLGDRTASKEAVDAWRESLQERGYRPVTINSMLAAVNTFFRLMEWDCHVKFLKVQKKMFRDQTRDLTRAEYDRLLDAARAKGQERLALLMEAVCSTGIRVSEVKYLTVEAARRGRAEVSLKGKIRTILLSTKLCRKLLKYAKKQKIASGEVFLTKSGKSLSRRQIWSEMKRLCKAAGVQESKVFPHNLRHLFATLFHKAYKDIAKLADVLGHSSMETTRIYLLTTGAEHVRQLDRLGLVS